MKPFRRNTNSKRHRSKSPNARSNTTADISAIDVDPLHTSAIEGMYDENPMMYDGMMETEGFGSNRQSLTIQEKMKQKRRKKQKGN